MGSIFFDKTSVKLSFLNVGERIDVMDTTNIVIHPPKITEGIVPINLALTPDSNAPNSFDEPINILLTAATLPLISSGVKACMMVERTTTLTLSKIPLRKRQKRER